MKKLALLFSVVTLLVLSCSSDTKENVIVGTWKVTNFEADIPTLPPEVLKSAKETTMTNIFTFNEDNTFIMKSAAVPNGNTGNWIYNEELKILELNYTVEDNASKVIYKIEKVNDKEAKWLQDMKDMGTIYLTLVKG